jgi:chemotaxis protein MotB
MRIVYIPLICALGSACVTRTKYDALAAERDQATAELTGARQTAAQRSADAEAFLGEVRAALDHCQQRTTELEAVGRRRSEEVLEAERETLAIAAELEKLQQQLAQVIRDRSRLGASVDEMRRALATVADREREARRRVAEYREVVARFKDLIDAGKLQVRVVDGRMVLTLPMDILFPSGSAKLSREGTESLQQLGEGLASIPGRRFQVEGHTDTVPIHTASYPSNWELASARAMVVLRTLLAAGIAPDRISAASFGEHRPTADNISDSGKAMNRRIELVLLPDLSSLPGYAELQQLSSGG